MNRFRRVVKKYGNSKIIRVPELDVGTEVIVMTEEELNFLLGKRNDE